MSSEPKAPSHLYLKSPDETNSQTSCRLADGFCRAFNRSFGASAEVRSVESDGVDAIIEIEGRRIALEFVSYRQQDEFFQDEAADSHVKEAISSHFVACGVAPLQISISWGTEERRKQVSRCGGKRATIPKKPKVSKACQELVELARLVGENPAFAGQRLAFHRDPEARNRRVQAGWRFLNSSDFPVLAEYCCFVKMEPWNHPSQPEIRTSVDVRYVGLDEAQLRSVVMKKLDKLPEYRRKWSGELWLVVHSDGHPLSTLLPTGHRNDAIDLIASSAKTVPRSFDKVWWMEDAAYRDAGLHEVEA
jgi:hypothetical protein